MLEHKEKKEFSFFQDHTLLGLKSIMQLFGLQIVDVIGIISTSQFANFYRHQYVEFLCSEVISQASMETLLMSKLL